MNDAWFAPETAAARAAGAARLPGTRRVLARGFAEGELRRRVAADL